MLLHHILYCSYLYSKYSSMSWSKLKLKFAKYVLLNNTTDENVAVISEFGMFLFVHGLVSCRRIMHILTLKDFERICCDCFIISYLFFCFFGWFVMTKKLTKLNFTLGWKDRNTLVKRKFDSNWKSSIE